MKRPVFFLWLAAFAAAGLSGCQDAETGRLQGYAEAEYVYVSSPVGGTLGRLLVRRGDRVDPGAGLFVLERAREAAAVKEAEARVSEAESRLADARKGIRPSELESLRAQLRQAEASLTLSRREYGRLDQLVRSGASARDELDRARAALESDLALRDRIRADLVTGELGAREDLVAAAAEAAAAQEAALTQARWNHDQKSQAAPAGGLVFDALFREGEWVPAGRPVVALLPPENIRVRAFVPEERLGAVRHGDPARVHVDGAPPLDGRVSYISPQAEYTPPVIFSRETRSKLVYLIEISFDGDTAARLHPGQPVEVELPESGA